VFVDEVGDGIKPVWGFRCCKRTGVPSLLVGGEVFVVLEEEGDLVFVMVLSCSLWDGEDIFALVEIFGTELEPGDISA